MSVNHLNCWKEGLNFKRYYILERTSVSFNAMRREKDAVPFQTDCKLPVYPSSSVPTPLQTVISMTGSSVSFLVCPFRFMKVRDILPGCLLNCLSSLEPAIHAPLWIFYADSPFPCRRAPPRACSHRVRRDTSLMPVCFARSRSRSCQFRLLTGGAQTVRCVNRPGICCWGTSLLDFSVLLQFSARSGSEVPLHQYSNLLFP